MKYIKIYKKRIVLNKNKIIPKLVIVKSNNIDAINDYIGQKVKRGEKIGIKVKVLNLEKDSCVHKKQIT